MSYASNNGGSGKYPRYNKIHIKSDCPGPQYEEKPMSKAQLNLIVDSMRSSMNSPANTYNNKKKSTR